jgi:hypothetical protein
MSSRNSTADEVQGVKAGTRDDRQMPAVSEKDPLEAPREKAWKHDEQEIPKNNLPLVFFSLLLATFLVSNTSVVRELIDSYFGI